MLTGKRILLGVTGGIAVYKAVSLCSRLAQAGAEVRVILTQSAAQFVTPLTFQTISRQPVYTDLFAEKDPSVVAHIDLADHADLVVIAPATANIIAKLAHGLADDMLSTTLLATTAPILVAPAMNVHMLAHPAVQHNLEILRQRGGIKLLDPDEGQLACGYVGKGRLPEPEVIFQAIEQHFNSGTRLAGKQVLITAGGTIERIDPVRYISNDSSGKMGYALAEAAQQQGAEVTLISANVSLSAPIGVRVIPVVSAQEMHDTVMQHMDQMDIIIKAAAVADYRPLQIQPQKMKKNEAGLNLQLEKTPDILYELGKRKNKQFIVGFAAETEELEANAIQKLKRKNCDLIIANNVSQDGVGFGANTNEVSIYDAGGLVAHLPLQSKSMIASQIVGLIADRLNKGGSA